MACSISTVSREASSQVSHRLRSVLACQRRQIKLGNRRQRSFFRRSGLAKDIRSANDGILDIRPVSPSKLSASLKSNAMTVFRVNRSMKYRSAPTAI